jgi:two-component sensor histidine kinase
VTSGRSALPDTVREGLSRQKRLETLASLDVLDTENDPDFDRLTRVAAGVFGAPVSLVTLVDLDNQWFKSHHGTEISNTPVDLSFCAHAIAVDDREPMVVLDATADERFSSNELVTGDEHIRFYAGVPLSVHGEKLGTLCVLDRSPRDAVDPEQLAQLRDLAALAGSLFELKDEARVRARTTAELIKEEWRHALTLEAGKVGSWAWDLTRNEVSGNDIIRRMYGIDPVGQMTADDFFSAVVDEDLPAANAALQATFDDGVDYEAEFRVKSGRWISSRGRVYQRDAEGKPLVMMGVSIDVTDAREASDHTRYLLRELNHRVKNTLAMTQSLARQTLKQSANPQDFIDAFGGRLRTLADAHALLADQDWAGIGMLDLVETQVGPFALTTGKRLSISGEDLLLPPDHALGLGIILHELASNAARHGALSTPKGTVRVSWTFEDGEVRLNWIEAGGPPVDAQRQTGFGSRLIQRSLDKVLGSKVELDFLPDGVEASIAFPLT